MNSQDSMFKVPCSRFHVQGSGFNIQCSTKKFCVFCGKIDGIVGKVDTSRNALFTIHDSRFTIESFSSQLVNYPENRTFPHLSFIVPMMVLYYLLLVFGIIWLIRFLFKKFLDLPRYRGKTLADGSGLPGLMPEDDFWEIIDGSLRASNRNYEFQCDLLTGYLEQLTEEDIVAFDKTFTVLMAKSYRFKLWEPAYALNGGCSDDLFEYFRTWLIAQGRNKFYWSLRYPRLLFLFAVKEMMQNYEGIALCAYHAHLNKYGREIPREDDIHYPDPGPIFNEGKAILKYPELALLAW